MKPIYSVRGYKDYWDEFWRQSDISSEVCNVTNIYEMNLLDKYLPPEGVILEAGCGLGRLLIPFASKGYGVIGLENIFYPLNKIKNFNSDIPLICGDVINLPFLNCSFDAYIAMGVFSWLKEDFNVALKEVRRVLKSNGILIISVPNENLFFEVRNRLASNNFLRRMIGKKSCEWGGFMFKMKELKSLLNDACFEILGASVTYPQAGFWLNFFPFRNLKSMKKWFFNKRIFIRESRDGIAPYGLNLIGKKIYKFLLERNPALFSLGILVVAKKSNKPISK